ncbi:unnamed protein product [Effrenium voratum]|nr:unnamed protein product [Effrenium voratum]
MKQCPDLDFEVRWLPYQLNPSASQEPQSRIEAYQKKFGKGIEEVKAMGGFMKSKFDAVELPFNFTDKAKISNTFDAHRVLTAAFKQGGAAAQDKAAEVLFEAYFAAEKAPNDPEALKKAAAAAGLAENVLDKSFAAEETKEEMKVGQQLSARGVLHGVPHFVISEDTRVAQISGAEPPESFVQAFQRVAK